MDIKTIKTSVFAMMSVAASAIVSNAAFAAERPELAAYPYKTAVTEGDGAYVAADGSQTSCFARLRFSLNW